MKKLVTKVFVPCKCRTLQEQLGEDGGRGDEAAKDAPVVRSNSQSSTPEMLDNEAETANPSQTTTASDCDANAAPTTTKTDLISCDSQTKTDAVARGNNSNDNANHDDKIISNNDDVDNEIPEGMFDEEMEEETQEAAENTKPDKRRGKKWNRIAIAVDSLYYRCMTSIVV